MNSLRLQCGKLNIYRNAFNLFEKCVKSSIRSYSSISSVQQSDIDAEEFKAAVLHPKKQSLAVETLVLPDKAADGMVNI